MKSYYEPVTIRLGHVLFRNSELLKSRGTNLNSAIDYAVYI